MLCEYDPDAYDVEVIAERLPCADFRTADLMRFFGVSRVRIWDSVRTGRIPRGTKDGEGKNHWTALEVAQMVLAGNRAWWPELAPCGTYAAYRRHIAHREPVDEACANAQREHHRERWRRQKQRQRMGAA